MLSKGVLLMSGPWEVKIKQKRNNLSPTTSAHRSHWDTDEDPRQTKGVKLCSVGGK